MPATTPCPCHSGAPFAECCQPLLSGHRVAARALDLMRSRYTAYALRQVAYLLATWHPSTRPQTLDPATIPEWQGLTIVRTEQGGEADTTGVVEFRAMARVGQRSCQLHEVSRFVKEEGRWFYTEGDLRQEATPASPSPPKVGRNDPCPCGSGKKYKRCCAS